MIGLGIVLVALASPAQTSAFATGNKLLAECEQGPQTGCIGYIIGAVDAFTTAQTAGAMSEQFCLPENNFVQGQARDIVVRYLRNHPELRHNAAASLVVPALREAFPCKSR